MGRRLAEVSRHQNRLHGESRPAVIKDDHRGVHERHHENRHMGTTQDPLGGRSQQQLAKSTESLGAHHDEVGALSIGAGQNQIGRVSHTDVDTRVRQRRVNRQHGLHELAQRWCGLRGREIQAEARPGRLRKERIDRGDNRQPALMLYRERHGPSKCLSRLVRKVNGAEDRAKRRHGTPVYCNIKTFRRQRMSRPRQRSPPIDACLRRHACSSGSCGAIQRR